MKCGITSKHGFRRRGAAAAVNCASRHAVRGHVTRCFCTHATAVSAAVLLGGCSLRGAPSLILFGAYFPDWMLCGLIGIVAAIVARVVFVATGLASKLPWQLLVCTSIGVIVAILSSFLIMG